jgi:uncharacterized membrane protein YcaP (DUF421 family)
VAIDWHSLFVPQTSLVALVIRGSVMYVMLFALLRLVVRRHIGALSIPDLLLIVLIADAAQNAMAGDSKTISEGVVLCGTLIAWSHAFDWLAFRFPSVGRWLDPPPLALIRHGRLQRHHLRQELITEEELTSQLRQQGIEDVRGVKLAFIEPDGHISVIKEKPASGPEAKSPRP